MKVTSRNTAMIFLGFAMFGFGCSPSVEDTRSEEARPAKIVTVGASSSGARTFPGRVQAAQRVALSFRVGGPVLGIEVSKGERVRKGEVLARIDTRDYEVQVKNLEAQFAASMAQSLQASEEYRRVRGLYEHDNASKSDFDRARAAVDVGEAQADATQQALKAARLSVEDTVLRAPFDGIVADRLVDAHQTVAAGQPVLLFQDLGGLEVLIDVPERDVAALTRKAPKAILVRFDALSSEEVPARVKEFATETDPQTQTFAVTLQLLDKPTVELLPGMTASVSWLSGNGDSQATKIVVPVGAMVTDETGAAFVWRVEPDSNRIARTAVTTGSLTNDGFEILSGLEPGDRVLAAGVHFVTDGQLVRTMED